MTKKSEPLVIIKDKGGDDPFVRVEVFLRVTGRLPTQKNDGLTQDILDKYITMYEAGELKECMIPLDYMYKLIKDGKMKLYR